FHMRDEMLEHARSAVMRATVAIPRWFGRLPRAAIVVEPYSAFRERQSVGEWNPPAEDGSRPGIYFLSTDDPRHKSRADLEALSFHEAIPGHHLQGSIAGAWRQHSGDRALFLVGGDGRRVGRIR